MKIKDFAQIINGATPSTKNKKYFCGNIVWVTPKDLSINKSKYIRDSEKRITEDAYNSCSTEMIPCDSILLSSRAPIGLLAINKVKCCTNQGFKSLILDKTKANVEYIYYYLKCNIKKIELLGGGTTFKEISKTILENLEIDLPNYKLQYKIAKILSSIDNKIGINNKINDELEAMAKTIYDYWFLQFEFPNEEGKPYKSSGGKMVWNEELKREIPEGWDLCTIEDISICHDAKRIPLSNKEREQMKGDIPYYGATGIMDYVNQYIFDGDYVLIAEDGSIMNDDGSPILQRISGKTWVNNHAHILEPIDNYSCKLLMMILKDIPVVSIKTGSIQMKINQKNLNKVKIVSVPNNLKNRINRILNDIDKKILLNKKENQELTSLRDFLLPLLMNGQVGFKENKAEG